jgi:hypothetical protein
MNMKTNRRRIALAGLSCLALCLPGWAAAQANVQEIADAAATAQGIQENPDCVTDAVVGQAVAEGARRLGAASGKLLGKIGVKTPGAAPAASAPANNPCKPAGAQAAGTPQGSAPAAAPVAGPVAAPARPRYSTNRPASGGRNCGALGTGCADGMKPLVACMDEKNGWLWKVLADTVEAKRDRSPGLTAQQRIDIDADIAALRAAHVAGARRVEPVDPARPERYNSWLTPEEYSVAATGAMQSIDEHTKACNDKHSRF